MNDLLKLLLGAAISAGPVLHACAQQAPAEQAAPGVAANRTDGEVRRVDKATGKISLKHDEIKNLDMPPMTMVFGVKDPVMLDRVKAGDKVRFTAEKVGGVYVVTSIEVVK
jgi:Cu/Ag efflux protein CusF